MQHLCKNDCYAQPHTCSYPAHLGAHDLEALLDDRQQVGGGIALHPDVSVVHQRADLHRINQGRRRQDESILATVRLLEHAGERKVTNKSHSMVMEPPTPYLLADEEEADVVDFLSGNVALLQLISVVVAQVDRQGCTRQGMTVANNTAQEATRQQATCHAVMMQAQALVQKILAPCSQNSLLCRPLTTSLTEMQPLYSPSCIHNATASVQRHATARQPNPATA